MSNYANLMWLGGVGKMQLAIEYAYRLKDDYDGLLAVMPASFAAAARARLVAAAGGVQVGQSVNGWPGTSPTRETGRLRSADFIGQRRTGSGAGGGRPVATAHCDAVLTSELQYEASRAAEMALPFRAHQPFKGRAAAVGQGSSPKQAGGSVGASESVADV